MSKRTKASKTQIVKIIEFMESNPKLNKGVINSEFSAKDKADKWIELAEMLNSEGHCIKSVDKWQKCWSDQKVEVKKRYQKTKKYTEGTGGGPAPKNISDIDLRILALIGHDAYEGLAVKENIPPVLSCSVIEEMQKSPNAHELFSCILNVDGEDIQEDSQEEETPMLTPQFLNEKTLDDTPQNKKKPPSRPFRTRSRGLVLPAEKVQKLISAQEDTHKALGEIALHLQEANIIARERNEIEQRKATAFERIAEYLNKK